MKGLASRLRGVIATAVLLSSVCHTSAQSVVYLQLAAPEAAVGDTVLVDVMVYSAADLYAWQFDLAFQPDVLSFIGPVAEGDFLAGGGPTYFVSGADSGGGQVTGTAAVLLTAVPGVDGSGRLATLAFSAIAAGDSTLTLSNVLLFDSQLSPLVSATQETVLTVTEAVNSVPEPAARWLLAAGGALLVAARRRMAPSLPRNEWQPCPALDRPAAGCSQAFEANGPSFEQAGFQADQRRLTRLAGLLVNDCPI